MATRRMGLLARGQGRRRMSRPTLRRRSPIRPVHRRLREAVHGRLHEPRQQAELTALWLIALHDATGKPVYRERAEKWWRVMKSRMRLRDGGRYYEWNYWDPAGPWDYKPDGSAKHWIGVHPNGGYYAIDLEGIVTAYEHNLVFTQEQIDRLIATNRDFMWNHKINGAKFQRIDGGSPDSRWRNSPGVLWVALVPYDETCARSSRPTTTPRTGAA